MTRSATFTAPPGPPRNGVIPKSVCLTEKVDTASRVSPVIRVTTSSGTVRVRPTSVMAPTTWKPPSFRCTSCETSRITG